MYVLIMLNSDGNFDPEYNDVIGPFDTRAEAREYADAEANYTDRLFTVVELVQP